jgi:hypothetical protein
MLTFFQWRKLNFDYYKIFSDDQPFRRCIKNQRFRDNAWNAGFYLSIYTAYLLRRFYGLIHRETFKSYIW